MKNIFKNIVVVSSVAFALSSCTKNFEEINTDPNSPTTAPITTLLSYGIMNHASAFYDPWGDMNEPSTYSGHLAKHSYIDESRYTYRPNSIENIWTSSSRELKNLDIARVRASEEGLKNMEGATLTIQTMIWMVVTDRWRDVPYFDAMKGDQGVISPPYSKQEDIYPDLLNRLKTAGDLLNSNATDALGAGDLIFDNNIVKWAKFANSLRLRAAMRISNVDPNLAKQHIEEVMGNPAKYPIMETNDDNAFVLWPGTAPYQEPWQLDGLARDDYSVANYLINELLRLDDPRLPVYAHKNAKGIYKGAPVGAKNNEIENASEYSRIGARFRDVAAGFSPFMRAAEVYFDIAEAGNKGWQVGMSAKAAYERGVKLSMEENGVSANDLNSYLSGKGAYDGTLNSIYVQKWLAVFKNGQEAWALTRRTDLFKMPAASGSPYAGHTRPPFRYPYPTSETQLNSKNSAAFVAEVEDSFWGKQMWWDTRTGVK